MFAARETRVSFSYNIFFLFRLFAFHLSSECGIYQGKSTKEKPTNDFPLQILKSPPERDDFPQKAIHHPNKPWTPDSVSNLFLFSLITDVWPTSTTTESAATAFPSRLRDARSEIQVLSAEDRETWAMTTTACPQCANPEMRYRDVQLRGADEGSTVFYRCPKCDYK
jgi:predicted RNA-binding Zn-ribbon protein involved in translation (DUF1610 family)